MTSIERASSVELCQTLGAADILNYQEKLLISERLVLNSDPSLQSLG